ncbi:uncharacterized protein LOC141718806 [Apium graveolens]|uniref:uncharacterized protein LOC141718806 n=1 Tax=Apium graveolens TaxID=4045 RepID=UPI003D7B80F3
MLWDDIEGLCLAPLCSCGCKCGVAQKLSKLQQDQKVIQFLMGLNDTYSVMRGYVLMSSPLPSIGQVYNILLQEESQREIQSGAHFMSDSASLAVNTKFQSGSSQGFRRKFNFESKKSILHCNYCKKPGHLIDKCYKLHGFPADFKFTKPKRMVAHVEVADTNNNNGVSSPGTPSALLVSDSNAPSSVNFAGNSAHTACLINSNYITWIIDSGASDHMCAHKSLFSSINPLAQPITVSLPNGHTITISSIGTVPISPDLILQNVLFVPHFKFNLLSVHKLTEQLHCTIHFSHDGCFLQGSSLKMPLALGKLNKGLYLFSHVVPDSMLGISSFSSPQYCNNVEKSYHNSTVSSSVQPNPELPLRKSTRSIKPPTYLQDYIHPYQSSCKAATCACTIPSLCTNASLHVPVSSCHYVSRFLSTPVSEPHLYEEAIKFPEWKDVIAKEFSVLEAKTWELVSLPPGKKAISCKWVFKIKHHVDGSIERYKASLVVKGFTQKLGVDYTEFFFPVVKMTTIRTLVVVVKKGWHMSQLDVNNAFLHGDLHDDVPPDNGTLSFVIFYLIEGITRLKMITLFSTRSQVLPLFFLAVYIDDILVMGNDMSEITSVKQALDSTFKIKDLSPVHYFMGIEFNHVPDGIILSQRKFTLELLNEFDPPDSTVVVSPLDLNVKFLHKTGLPISDPSLYRKLVGKLNFITHTRPDLAFCVQHLSQFMFDPRLPHWTATLHVLRYLKNDPAQGLFFSNTPSFSIQGYCDADWGACPHSRRSVSGFVILLEFEVPGVIHVPIKCDNQDAIYIAKNLVYHERTKYIDIDCHFVREKLSSGLITLSYTPTKDQLDDVLTKPLTGLQHHAIIGKLAATCACTIPSLCTNPLLHVPVSSYHNVSQFLSTPVSEPHSYKKAIKYHEWQDAIAKEFSVLEANKTWELVPLPPGKKAISCKWVFKIKRHADGSIERYKARLVVKGFTQKLGVDYTETFSPIVKMTTIRTLVAVVVKKGWHMSQLDVNNTFLHGDLHEDVYMKLKMF